MDNPQIHNTVLYIFLYRIYSYILLCIYSKTILSFSSFLHFSVLGHMIQYKLMDLSIFYEFTICTVYMRGIHCNRMLRLTEKYTKSVLKTHGMSACTIHTRTYLNVSVFVCQSSDSFWPPVFREDPTPNPPPP